MKQWCIPPLRRHRGSDPLSSVLFFWQAVNIGSRAYYISAGSGAHCPLINGIVPGQGREVDLVPCGPSPLEINFNNDHLINVCIELSHVFGPQYL
jgi:hypothetical protein